MYVQIEAFPGFNFSAGVSRLCEYRRLVLLLDKISRNKYVEEDRRLTHATIRRYTYEVHKIADQLRCGAVKQLAEGGEFSAALTVAQLELKDAESRAYSKEV